MREIERDARPQACIGALAGVWERSVRATHDFLTEAEIERIGRIVPDALRTVDRLVVEEDGGGRPEGFLGAGDGRIEMLFVDPDVRGTGVGTRLLRYGVERCGARELDVNEQNTQARAFYAAKGFRVVGRSETDGQGAAYPILHLRLA